MPSGSWPVGNVGSGRGARTHGRPKSGRAITLGTLEPAVNGLAAILVPGGVRRCRGRWVCGWWGRFIPMAVNVGTAPCLGPAKSGATGFGILLGRMARTSPGHDELRGGLSGLEATSTAQEAASTAQEVPQRLRRRPQRPSACVSFGARRPYQPRVGVRRPWFGQPGDYGLRSGCGGGSTFLAGSAA